ncbi:non-canonical purine NTP pyrophosphatase [Pseudidiomarina terrestris]|uniref:non-canonical purine NTP pyrophosphatase n=1 Tax=Pseudidiomarina terrestris TaxID=2820060 RepID=UPI002652F488|nr:non-canonical purine NTP pyrophosphatase [Pseudidiomarina sp. 1ASP75-5]MDN7134551.1 non-canonical purine NTP pyrophosphatase [Pseudidiomarina sp. 1ASP75-5]
MTKALRFVSRNEYKIQEMGQFFHDSAIEVIPVKNKLEELQTTDIEKLVKDKAVKAFKLIGRPLFVEHTGLKLEYLNGYPGGLTQILWDSLEADKFCELFGQTDRNKLSAETVIGYVDGRCFHLFKGEVRGTVSATPRGDRSFQWDCVFIPEEETRTFSEMGVAKNEISMRNIAVKKFIAFLENQ